MKRFAFMVTALAIAVICVDVYGRSSWGSGACVVNSQAFAAAPVGAQVPATVTAATPDSVYEWRKGTQTQDWLYRDGECIGQWYTPEQQFYPWDGARIGVPCKPPIDPPSGTKKPFEAWQLSGVMQSQIAKHEHDSYTVLGKAVSPGIALSVLEGKEIGDDSEKMNFLIWAADANVRAKMIEDFSKLPAEFRERCKLWAAPPSHWSWMDRETGKPRFQFDKDPSFMLTDKAGVVLVRHPKTIEQSYQGLQDMQMVLKADPGYKKEKDPGLPGTEGGESIPLIFWIVGGIIALTFLRNRSE